MSGADWAWYAATTAVFVPAALWVTHRRAVARRRRWARRHSYDLTVTVQEDAASHGRHATRTEEKL